MFHKVIITLLKPLSFLPALLVMYMIFSFSAQNGTESGDLSFKVSVKLVEVGSEVLDMKLTDSEIQMYANKYTLCKKTRPYDRILCLGDHALCAVVCVRCAGHLAVFAGGIDLCRICGNG